jgi:hypothetical protein
MGMLRSALDEVLAVDAATLTDEELHDDLLELERASRAIEAARAARVAEAERRRTYASDGFLSMGAWLRARLGISASAAAEQVRLARAMAGMPVAFGALRDGRVAPAAISILTSAFEADAAQYAASEVALVELAETLPLRDLARVVEHWRQLADVRSGDDVARRRFDRRGLFVSSTLDGMVRLDGTLDPETGGTVLAAVRSIVDGWSRSVDDARRPSQRRADALGEICRFFLARPDRASVAGERPHVTVHVDLETLEGRAGRRCDVDGVGRVTAEAARRIACDATLGRVILGPSSEPLDVGRRTSVVPPAIRRALAVRDARCRFPGCDRPPPWCDAHHVVHWADGGPTSLPNLVLLCRPHHRAVHDRFRVELVDGRPAFRRIDGTVLREGRAPP